MTRHSLTLALAASLVALATPAMMHESCKFAPARTRTPPKSPRNDANGPM